MIANARFHCWRDAQRLMNPTEIVVHEIKRQRVFAVFRFFENSFPDRTSDIERTNQTTHGIFDSMLDLNVRRWV
jgi:hypothetical protein